MYFGAIVYMSVCAHIELLCMYMKRIDNVLEWILI